MNRRSPFARLATLAALAAGLAACNSSTELSLDPVTSGSVGGYAFHVTGGTIFQAEPNGPIYGDASGGRLVFDLGPSGLGMTNASRLQLRTQFALSSTGSVLMSAYGDAGNEFTTGLRVNVARVATDMAYEMLSDATSLVVGTFDPPPFVPSAETWVVAEFYANDVPGFGSGQSGITLWKLDDLAPAVGSDVIGCSAPRAIDATNTHPGTAVGYQLTGGWITDVKVVNNIVGPCP